MGVITKKCLECGTTNPKDFSGSGVTYCDKCVLKTSKPLRLPSKDLHKEFMDDISRKMGKIRAW